MNRDVAILAGQPERSPARLLYLPGDQHTDPTRAMYGGLQAAFEFMNRELFKPCFGLPLPNCMITLRATGRTYGYFSPERFVGADGEYTHEIAMNPAGFACRSVEISLSTLAHEMVHLLQVIDGTVGRLTYHNAAFAERMEIIGLVPSHTGKPGGKRTAQRMTHYIDPDGRFLAAMHEFLVDGFRARWADRFTGALAVAWDPSHTPLTPTLEPEPSQAALIPAFRPLDGELDPDLDDDDEPNQVCIDLDHDQLPATVVELPGSTGPDDVDATPCEPAAGGSTDVEPQLPHKPMEEPLAAQHPGKFVQGRMRRSTNALRHKYQCPTCCASAWGKPSLNLKCGDCNEAMLDRG